jgi:cation transporter-like permease
MKKQLLIILTICSIFLPAVISTAANAAQVFGSCTDSTSAAGTPDVCTDVTNTPTTDPVIGALRDVINIISIVIGVAAVVVIIISGLRMILSGGDPARVKQAREGIIYALVGIGVTVFAQLIVIFVLNKI